MTSQPPKKPLRKRLRNIGLAVGAMLVVLLSLEAPPARTGIVTEVLSPTYYGDPRPPVWLDNQHVLFTQGATAAAQYYIYDIKSKTFDLNDPARSPPPSQRLVCANGNTLFFMERPDFGRVLTEYKVLEGRLIKSRVERVSNTDGGFQPKVTCGNGLDTFELASLDPAIRNRAFELGDRMSFGDGDHFLTKPFLGRPIPSIPRLKPTPYYRIEDAAGNVLVPEIDLPYHRPWGMGLNNPRGIPYAKVIPLEPVCQLSPKGEVACAELQKLGVPHHYRFPLVRGFEPAKPGLVAFLGTDSTWDKVRPDWTSSLLTYSVNKLFGREPAERRVNSVFGIFLLKEGATPVLIIRGLSSVFSVSPDGCTVAAYTRPGLYGPHQTTISHICTE